MAIVHRADLRPTKLDLLTTWLPTRPWYPGGSVSDLARVASFRFDDPAGEVGIETMLVRAGDGPVLQVPLTYRAAPRPGGEAWLVGTTEHSVLGPRWVYDGCGDPVYAAALAHAILTGAGQAEEFVDFGDRLEARAPSVEVRGSGSRSAQDVVAVGSIDRVVDADPALIVTAAGELVVLRVLDAADPQVYATLRGSGPGAAAAEQLRGR